MRRISSIREEDLRTTPLSPVTEATPDEVFPVEASPEEKPTVIKQRRDAETMTVPVVQEQVGTGRIRREDSVITEIADERDQLQELRGVPIEHRGTMTDPQIQKVRFATRTEGCYICVLGIDTGFLRSLKKS